MIFEEKTRLRNVRDEEFFCKMDDKEAVLGGAKARIKGRKVIVQSSQDAVVIMGRSTVHRDRGERTVEVLFEIVAGLESCTVDIKNGVYDVILIDRETFSKAEKQAKSGVYEYIKRKGIGGVGRDFKERAETLDVVTLKVGETKADMRDSIRD